MQQVELFPVPNPCVGICQSNAKGFCMGCLRSRTERQKWNEMMPAEKMRVIELCDLRRAKLEAMLKAKREGRSTVATSNGVVEQNSQQANSVSSAEEATPEQGVFFKD